MKWGMLCRGEDRGLGILAWEAHRHLHPDRTLLVDLGALAGGFPVHPERYPDATRLLWTGGPLDAAAETLVRDWLDGLDVVLTFETWYDHRIVNWAREAGVATAQMVMPEFWRSDLEVPDVVWAPTTWRLDQLPDATRLVPVPVALDRFPLVGEAPGPALRVLHPAGHRAAADRNGTQLALKAAALLTERVHFTILGQDRRLPSTSVARRRGQVTVRAAAGGQADYWDTYVNQDVLLMPRRYGGLSLPVQEGLAAGLVPVMPDVSPNGDWPAVLVPARTRGTMAVPAGQVTLAATDPRALAAAVDALARDRTALAARRDQALAWAQAHSWETLGPLWLAELDRAR